VNALKKDSLLFTEGSDEMLQVFNNTEELFALKFYLYYEDAWWVNDLGMTDGTFQKVDTNPPISGRYHDGPLVCAGRCRGALLAYYGFDEDQFSYYYKYQGDPSKHLTILNRDFNYEGILELHSALMDLHREIASGWY